MALLFIYVFQVADEIRLEDELESYNREELHIRDLILIADNTLVPQGQIKPQILGVKVQETIERRMRITAYAPLDWRAIAGMCHNGDPTSTASGKYPQYGMVATNALPFGTEIKIPELFGDEIFVVEDRMSSRYQNTIDVLVDNQDYAFQIGVKWANVKILQ